jgi:hypothetical protein
MKRILDWLLMFAAVPLMTIFAFIALGRGPFGIMTGLYIALPVFLLGIGATLLAPIYERRVPQAVVFPLLLLLAVQEYIDDQQQT